MSFRSLLWPWIILIIGLSAVPYLALQFLAPAGSQFLGAVINPDDLSVYLAAIQQGAAGEWLFTVTFTPETIAPRLTYPFYLLLGRLAAQLSIDPLWLFHISRVVAGLFLMLLVVAWLDYLDLTQVKRDAFILIFLSGGWGWLALAAGWILPDIHVAEWTPFLTLTYAPHFILGLAAEILVMTALLTAYRRGTAGVSWLAIALAVFGAASLGLLYAFRIIPLFGLIGLYVLLETGRNWRQRPALILTSFPPLLILGSMGLYYAIAARTDPLWEATYVVQNNIPSPKLLETFMGWGIPGLLLAFAGVPALKNWSRLPDAIRLCFIWFGVGALCLYLPVSFQGRFALGVYLPLAVIAAWSLHNQLLPRIAHWQESDLMRRLTPTPLATTRRVVLILAVPSILVFLGMSVRRAEFFPEQYFLPLNEIQAAKWLAKHSHEDDLILAGDRMGNYLPRHIAGRVFVGQYYVTVNPDQKVALARQFFLGETENAWRLDFLAEWGITHIYYGHYESQVGPPPDLPGWDVVYAVDGITIYRGGRN